MKNKFNAEVGGDNSYYWGHVSDTLSWDAYGRYEALPDECVDIAHFLRMDEPLRVAASPAPAGLANRGVRYACERCGVLRKKQARRVRDDLMCADCVAVERGAVRPPTKAMEQHVERFRPVEATCRNTPLGGGKSQAARHRKVRRLRQQREQYVHRLKDSPRLMAKQPPPKSRKPKQESLSPREAAAAKQLEQERQFLQDLQDSGAEWLLKASHN